VIERSLSLTCLALCVALPRLASACAVCFSGSDDTRFAYLFTTALLSVLPLAVLGAFVGWARWRVKALARESQQRPAPEPSLLPRG
jgi:hypothetical protein